jgi:hypothetical protein
MFTLLTGSNETTRIGRSFNQEANAKPRLGIVDLFSNYMDNINDYQYDQDDRDIDNVNDIDNDDDIDNDVSNKNDAYSQNDNKNNSIDYDNDRRVDNDHDTNDNNTFANNDINNKDDNDTNKDNDVNNDNDSNDKNRVRHNNNTNGNDRVDVVEDEGRRDSQEVSENSPLNLDNLLDSSYGDILYDDIFIGDHSDIDSWPDSLEPSGRDLPPEVSVDNLRNFFEAVKNFSLPLGPVNDTKAGTR